MAVYSEGPPTKFRDLGRDLADAWREGGCGRWQAVAFVAVWLVLALGLLFMVGPIIGALVGV